VLQAYSLQFQSQIQGSFDLEEIQRKGKGLVIFPFFLQISFASQNVQEKKRK
jgi:hypothetical protein